MNQPAHPSSLGAISRKDYTGQFIVVHSVQQGQSLSQIAAAYGFKRWEPIWVYNTKIEKTLGDDPALVQRGVSIFIPRSAAGYDRLISRFEQCKLGLEAAVDATGYELEALENEYGAKKVALNAAGDALTLLVSFGVMAVRAAKAAGAARAAVGQAKIAANLSARAETKHFAEAYARHRNRLTRTALDKNKAAVIKRVERTDFVKGRSVDTVVNLADRTLNHATGRDDEFLKHGKNLHASHDLQDTLRQRKISLRDGFVDAIGIALDYLEVSKVCEIAVFGWGGSFEDSNRQTLNNATGTAARMTALLDAKIQRVSEEKKRLYG